VFRANRPLAAWLLAVGVSAACAVMHRQTADEPGLATSTSAVSHTPWRPLHKGGADLSTGVYIREDDDLVVKTPFPVVLRRTYNSGDGYSRQFGMNATHPGEWWIRGDSDPRVPWAELILANGGRIRFVRISPGATKAGAVLRHDATPTEFDGALLSWTGALWRMKFRDGSAAFFLDCEADPAVCALVERRDPDGHRISYVRDPSGTLLRMESDGQSIAFDYDHRKRIVRAYDSLRLEVRYSYDDRGRLVRAVASDGVVRSYEYNDHDKLVGVREPGRILRNWFDSAGRWIGQVVKNSEDDEDLYAARARYVVEDGAIVESYFDEGRGLVAYRYNADHYVVSETLAADGPAPIVITYARDAASNSVTGTTISCTGSSGPITRAVQLPSDRDEAAKMAAIRATCLAASR
jgi:YD repeat-containing protein